MAGSNRARGSLKSARGEISYAHAAYSLLMLHPCITHGQIQKELYVRVDFML